MGVDGAARRPTTGLPYAGGVVPLCRGDISNLPPRLLLKISALRVGCTRPLAHVYTKPPFVLL